MQPSLPVELLGQIVDSLVIEETTHESESKSPTLLKLLSTSRAFRVCALRNLCKTVIVACNDDKANDKLLEILIPGTINPGLENIAPFIQILQINLRSCISSPAGLAKLSTLLDSILEQCALQTLVLEGTYDDEAHPDSNSDLSVHWAELPSSIRRAIEALFRMPLLRSLKIYSISGLFKDPFDATPLVDLLVINFSLVLPVPALAKLRRIVAYDLGTPAQIDGVWNICRYAHRYLEELEIDDAFWDIDAIGLRNKPYAIPDSVCVHSFPKLRKFTYSHNYVGWDDYSLCPSVSFFQVGDVVSELQFLHLRVCMDRVINDAAMSFKEAISRLADPNWIVLDSLLTNANFPNLQRLHLILEQDVYIASGREWALNADGVRCRLATKHALQSQIEESLRSSFPHLTASTVVDFKLEAIVNLNETPRYH